MIRVKRVYESISNSNGTGQRIERLAKKSQDGLARNQALAQKRGSQVA
jgi:hypothetical protein